MLHKLLVFVFRKRDKTTVAAFVLGFLTAWIILPNNLSTIVGYIPNRWINKTELELPQNVTPAQYLYQNVKVLCMVLTTPNNHNTTARIVKETWGKHCNKLIFMSSEGDEELGAVKLPIVERGSQCLWGKVKESFKYVNKHYIHAYEWFVKADDDTFIIPENLRFMLYDYSPENLIYFGCRLKFETDRHGFMSGGAGYVLSRAAVKKFVEVGLPNPKYCRIENCSREDTDLGLCMNRLKVRAGESRDWLGHSRFIPIHPDDYLSNKLSHDHWLKKLAYHGSLLTGLKDSSEYPISYHFIQPEYMRVLYYFVYTLKVFGIEYKYKLYESPYQFKNISKF